MSSTNFKNASGLHNPGQVTTARDMARLARYIIKEHPEYYHYFSTRNFSYRGRSYHNHNRLMETYKGMDGLKTGFIGPSGFNLVASARRGDRRLIGVVFGGQTAASRNAHMKKLLDDGFAKTGAVLVARAVPVPIRKPSVMQQTLAASGSSANLPSEKWADLNPILQSQTFRSLIGEGDYDPAETRRLETGLMAIAANRDLADARRGATGQAERKAGDWSIQVGAFESRVKTDTIIRRAQHALPADLASASPVIVPLKTAGGWIFRGRLDGFTKEQAERACGFLKECVPVSPQAR